jgi:hypothetical protein
VSKASFNTDFTRVSDSVMFSEDDSSNSDPGTISTNEDVGTSRVYADIANTNGRLGVSTPSATPSDTNYEHVDITSRPSESGVTRQGGGDGNMGQAQRRLRRSRQQRARPVYRMASSSSR